MIDFWFFLFPVDQRSLRRVVLPQDVCRFGRCGLTLIALNFSVVTQFTHSLAALPECFE